LTITEALIKLRDDIKTWCTNNFLAVKESIVQSDYAQNDTTALDYVKNRLAWTECEAGTEILPETTITITDSGYFQDGAIGLQEGQNYIVNWNGTEYECECAYIEDGADKMFCVGNLEIAGIGNSTGEPFMITDSVAEDTHAIITTSGDGDYTVSIGKLIENIHKINPKYLPEGGFGYTEEKCKMLFSQSSITFSDGMYAEEDMIGLQKGKKYTVAFNGEVFECVAKNIMIDVNNSAVYIGNERIAGGEDTGEPFACADIIESGQSVFIITNFDDSTENCTISITGSLEMVHKIDTKFLPNTTKDYVENDPTSPNYIANRPCYNGELIIDCEEIIANGATTVGNGSLYRYVKIHEYLPPGDWVYDTVQNGFNLKKSCDLAITHYGWSLSNGDGKQLFGVSEEAVASGAITIDLVGEVSESGIYSVYIIGMGAEYKYILSTLKPLDNSMLLIGYDDLIQKPFSCNEKEQLIGFYEPGRGATVIKDHIGYQSRINFHRFHYRCLAEDEIIGAELVLNDGSTKIITADDIIKANDRGFWEVENLLLCTDNTGYLSLGGCDYHFTNIGLYTTDYTGTYVTEIVLPTKIEQLDIKFLPDAIPKVETAEVGQTLVVKAVDGDGKPIEWEVMSLGLGEEVLGNLSDSTTLIVEDDGIIRRFPVSEFGAGYTDKGETVLTLALTNGAAQIEATSDVLEVGKTYTIRTDSGEYTGECRHSSAYGADVKHIGNCGLILPDLMTNNGLPYGVVYVNNTNPEMGEVGTFYGAADTNGGSTITVSIPDVIHTIDPKYLPSGIGGGLQRIELNPSDFAEVDSDETYLLATIVKEKSDLLTETAKKEEPIILKVNLGNGAQVCILNWKDSGSIPVYSCADISGDTILCYELYFDNTTGYWVFNVTIFVLSA